MVFLQANQRIAVFRSDRAGILIGHVDAGNWQADIVDNIVELIGRNDVADGLLDQIEQTSGFFDPGARLGADVHQDLSRIDRREKVLAQKRPDAERGDDAGEKAHDEHFRPASASISMAR